MPVKHNGFLFQHFEKIVCGIAGMVFVVACVYAISRMRSNKVEKLTGDIESLRTQIEQQMDEEPGDLEIEDYVEQWDRAFEVGDPGEIREAFWYPWPVYYSGRKMAVNEQYVLDFRAPLVPDSVKVEQQDSEEEKVIADISHPVGLDYSKVEVLTGEVEQGEAVLVGKVGDRVHRIPLVVDETIRERAAPPIGLEAAARRKGIEVSWRPNPDNEEGVNVQRYEIYRRRGRDLTDPFVKVKEVDVGDRGRDDREGREDERGEEDEEEGDDESYSWTDEVYEGDQQEADRDESADEGVKAEETYLYRIRAVAEDSEPPESKFSETVRAIALPTVDFEFQGQRGDALRFKVRIYRGGQVEEINCNNRIGDEIGTVEEEDDSEQEFLTGYYLIDFHPEAIRQDPYSRGRVIYMDARGRVRERWRGQTRVEDLWEAEPGEAMEDEDQREDEQDKSEGRRDDDGPGFIRPE
ncbi:MAG: hypothetical protein ACOCR1_01155 [Planctomycetota bacterium]